MTGYELISCEAHRTLITRKLKGLEDIIPVTSVHWHMQEKGMPHLFSSVLESDKKQQLNTKANHRLAIHHSGRKRPNTRRRRTTRSHPQRRHAPPRHLFQSRPGIQRSLHRANALRHQARQDRQQRVKRDHPNVLHRIRRPVTGKLQESRSLSRTSSITNRRDKCLDI